MERPTLEDVTGLTTSETLHQERAWAHYYRWAEKEAIRRGTPGQHAYRKARGQAIERARILRSQLRESSDELPNCVWRHAETPFADNH
jgi:hypothetical protein